MGGHVCARSARRGRLDYGGRLFTFESNSVRRAVRDGGCRRAGGRDRGRNYFLFVIRQGEPCCARPRRRGCAALRALSPAIAQAGCRWSRRPWRAAAGSRAPGSRARVLEQVVAITGINIGEQRLIFDRQARVDPKKRCLPRFVREGGVLFQPTHESACALIAFARSPRWGLRSGWSYFGRSRITHGTILTPTRTKTTLLANSSR